MNKEAARTSSVSEGTGNFLHVLRASAAVIVMIGHSLVFVFGLAPHEREHTSLAKVVQIFLMLPHEAVIVFFVLSGFLVGGKLLRYRKGRDDVWDYMLDRFSRIYTVAIPILTLSAILASLILIVDLRFPADGVNVGACRPTVTGLIGNFLVLNKIFIPTLCSDTPYWSIQNEMSYYILAGLGCFAVRFYSRGDTAWIAYVLVCALLTWGLSYEPTTSQNTLLYFGIWLTGMFGAARAWSHRKAITISFFAAYTVIALLVARKFLKFMALDLGVAFITLGAIETSAYAAFGSLFVGRKWLKPFVFWSDRSYTLYLCHFPIQYLIRRCSIYCLYGVSSLPVDSPKGWLISLSMVLGSFATALVAWQFFEGRTAIVRSALKKLFKFAPVEQCAAV